MKPALLPLAAAFALCAACTFAANPAPQHTELEAANGEFWSVKDETFFVFKSSPEQRVTLVGTNLKLVCDHLEITAVGIANKGPEKSDTSERGVTLPSLEKFKYLLATGNVLIVQGEREAHAGRAEVFPRDDKIVLTESPVIVDHAGDKAVNGVVDHSNDYVSAGEKITMLRGERRVQIEKPKFVGPQIKDLGFDKNKAAPIDLTAPKPEPQK